MTVTLYFRNGDHEVRFNVDAVHDEGPGTVRLAMLFGDAKPVFKEVIRLEIETETDDAETDVSLV